MVRFRMSKINVEQFAILKESVPQGEITVGLEVELKQASQVEMVGVGTSFSFESSGERFMVLKVFCEFQINPEDWAGCMSDDIVTIPKDTMDYLLSQTVGVSRGILHCKTEGTAFNHIVLPPLNVSDVIKEDVTFNSSR